MRALHEDRTSLLLGDYRRGPRYAVRRSQGLRNYLLFLTENGSGELVVPAGRWSIVPGDAVLLAPGIPHSYATSHDSGSWCFAWAHVIPDPSWESDLDWPSPLAGVAVAKPQAEAFAAALNTLRRAIAIVEGSWRQRRTLARCCIHEAILWAGEASSAPSSADPRWGRLVAFARANLGEKIDPAGLARFVGLSQGAFFRWFKYQSGQTPARWIEELRLLRASELLTEGMPVSEVADVVGFANPFHFSHRFRLRYGQSPRHWRASMAGRLFVRESDD